MIGSLILLVLGGLLAFLSWRKRRKVAASMSWPSVQGTVTSAGVKEEWARGDEDTADSVTYTPEVEYEFSAGGRVWHGNTLAFQKRGFGTSGKALEVLLAYRVGGHVQVFHDPGDPGNCVLQRKAPGSGTLGTIGIFLMVVAVALAIKGV